MQPGATSVPPRTPRTRRKVSDVAHQSDSQARIGQLLRDLAAVGPLRTDRIGLPGTTETLKIVRPADFDRLLDAAAGDPEQNLPYWAELWPSGIALAAKIVREPGLVQGKHVLEIGCGLGVTATAALRAGADLTVTDYAPEALALCALNALSGAGVEPTALRVNWRDPDAALLAGAGAGYSTVLAADVLYEDRDVEPLLAFTQRAVAPGGELWLAEPGRRPAARFLQTIVNFGWSVESEKCAGPWPDPEDNRKGVIVGIHSLTRG